jgi:hypothetical protein
MEIAAGAKDRTGAAQDNDTNTPVIAELPETIRQFGNQDFIEGVTHIGTMELNARDAAVGREKQMLIIRHSLLISKNPNDDSHHTPYRDWKASFLYELF